MENAGKNTRRLRTMGRSPRLRIRATQIRADTPGKESKEIQPGRILRGKRQDPEDQDFDKSWEYTLTLDSIGQRITRNSEENDETNNGTDQNRSLNLGGDPPTSPPRVCTQQ